MVMLIVCELDLNMADSDDEFDKRNVRDKFRHERSDYEKRDDRKSRETFPERYYVWSTGVHK
jgi:hypothetical protein